MLIKVLQLAWEDEHTIWTAPSGEEALGLVELLEPEVVITDLNMPGMSGLELINIVGARSPRPDKVNGMGKEYKDDKNVGALLAAPVDDVHPKIILYTAMLTPGLIAYTKDLGVACLPKSFELKEMKEAIARIFDMESTDIFQQQPAAQK